MKRLQQGVDALGQPIIGSVQQSDTIYTVFFSAANAPQYITPPAGANFCLFAASGGNDYFAQFGVTSGLSVPAANNLTGTGNAPELNPLLRELGGTSSIGLVTNQASGNVIVTMAFYS